jgi:cell division protein FtsZ
LTLVRSLDGPDLQEGVLQLRAVAMGLGGAGGNLVTHLMDAELKGVYCIAADTDWYNLQLARAHSKILLEHSNDAGARGDVELGKRLGLQVSDDMPQALRGADILFVLAGMGGGTGGGAAPIVAETARKNGALVIGLITKPFHFEKSKLHLAISCMRQMLNACDTVVLIDNHWLEQSSTILPHQFNVDLAGQTCHSLIESIAHTFADSALSTSDLRELRTMLRRGGLAKGAVGYSYSSFGAEEAALRALRNTMALGDLEYADGVFVNIAGGEHVQHKHLVPTLELLSKRINANAQFLYGHRIDARMQGTTRVTLLATGLSFPFSWGGYRKLPLHLHELEPDSPEEERLGLDLGLLQLEVFSD